MKMQAYFGFDVVDAVGMHTLLAYRALHKPAVGLACNTHPSTLSSCLAVCSVLMIFGQSWSLLVGCQPLV